MCRSQSFFGVLKRCEENTQRKEVERGSLFKSNFTAFTNYL